MNEEKGKEYPYEGEVFRHSMATYSDTETGTIFLTERPYVGEEISIDGNWRKIETIRHTETGLLIVLEDVYSDGGPR